MYFFFSCKLLQKVYRRWGLSINPVAGQQNAGAFSDILDTVKFRKLSPGLIFFRRPFWGAYFWNGLSTEGNLRFKIDWASLIVGSKFTVFCFVLLCIWGQFSQYKPPLRGAYRLEARFNGGFFALPVWGAYLWRSLQTKGIIFGILRYYSKWLIAYIPSDGPCVTSRTTEVEWIQVIQRGCPNYSSSFYCRS